VTVAQLGADCTPPTAVDRTQNVNDPRSLFAGRGLVDAAISSFVSGGSQTKQA
jgi:hypothetical protein